jgi:hypothetical protein
MVGGQVMKGKKASLSIVEVGNVGTWVHLRVKGIASERKLTCKRSMPQKLYDIR